MKSLKIGVVGPCGAGKTKLVKALKENGFHAIHIAQEHSYVSDMWKRISDPDILIFLDVSYPLTIKRRNLDWTVQEYEQELKRLDHARRHADLYIHTDELTPQEVIKQSINYIKDCLEGNL